MSSSAAGMFSDSEKKDELDEAVRLILGLNYLKQYPEKELWRLFVDGELYSPYGKKENAWLDYETREKSSLGACFNGLVLAIEYFLNPKKKELTLDLIRKIHFTVTKDVKRLMRWGDDIKISGRPALLPDNQQGKFRKQPCSIGIVYDFSSPMGILDSLSIIEDYPSYFGRFISRGIKVISPSDQIDKNRLSTIRASYKVATNEDLAQKIHNELKGGDVGYGYEFPEVSEDKITQLMQNIIQSYNEKIKEAKEDHEKLAVIVEHIRRFELLHPFQDANTRTFVNILGNIMLMQQGFPPATFYEPSIFYAFTTDELVAEVKEGIKNTMSVINKDHLFDYDTEKAAKIDSEKEKYYQESITPLVNILTRISSNPTLKL